MKSLLIVLIICAANALTRDEIPSFLTYKPGQRFWLYPFGKGLYRIIDLNDRIFSGPREIAESEVYYNLYTRKNPTVPQFIVRGDVNSLINSNFNKTKPTKVITHGWFNNASAPVCQNIKNLMLKVVDVNIICVDWGKRAFAPYFIAYLNVPIVGEFTGQLVDWLISQGSDIRNFHLMGHSLGAHATGIASRGVKSGKIPYVTGLDPASVYWHDNVQRIGKADAEYVEIIHSDAGYLGLNDTLGHNDFYPDGGRFMPGCGIDEGCSHSRSYELFSYSIDNKFFMADQCRDYNEIVNGKCSNLSRLHMGGLSVKPARGVFYLKTYPDPPYYKQPKTV